MFFGFLLAIIVVPTCANKIYVQTLNAKEAMLCV